MNQFKSTITDIETIGNLNLVTFDFDGNTLQMVSLELPSGLGCKDDVVLMVKPTSVGLAQYFNDEANSFNKLQVTITDIDQGKILTSLRLQIGTTIFESVITTNSFNQMDLKRGQNIIALINPTHLFIHKVCND